MRQLLAYQTLIVREAHHCGGRGWQAYDTMFHQQAVGNPDLDWSKLNLTLYSVTFLAQAGSGKNCVLCMELDHHEKECALAKAKVGSPIANNSSSSRDVQQSTAEVTGRFGRGKAKVVCFAWNQGHCSFPYCRYRHVCVKCGGEHRIIHCLSVGLDQQTWRRQGHNPQRCEPHLRDPQGQGGQPLH